MSPVRAKKSVFARHARLNPLKVSRMTLVPKFTRSNCWRKKASRDLLLIWLVLLALPATGVALPARLVLAVDGVAYRDLKALQAGFTGTNFWGKPFHRQAFAAAEGYFPVSRMISTFPSLSANASF